MAVLVALSGLPGVGKTAVARILAARIGAMHLRVDSVEAALTRSALGIENVMDAGYLTLAAVAGDNLRLGHDVIADTVNPVEQTRRLWSGTAASGMAQLVNVELACTDPAVHRTRVETRTSDIDGLRVPDWAMVQARRFDPWSEPRLVIDTAGATATACADQIARHVAQLKTGG